MIITTLLLVSITAIGVAWGLTADKSKIDLTAFKPIVETKVRPPRALFSSKEAWHSHHCLDRGIHNCVPVAITDIEPSLLNSIVPISQRTRVDIAFDKIFSKLIGFRRHTEWQQVDFSCCLRDPQYRYGYSLAESEDFIITYEHSPHDNLIRIAMSNKRHCVAPPMLPLGVPTYVRPRALAGWPDHLTMWLLTPESKMGYCSGNELPLWDETESSQNPHLSYPVPNVSARLIVPFVKYNFTSDDIALALDTLGLTDKQAQTITSEEGKVIYDVVKQIQADTVSMLNGNVKLTISQLATRVKELNELTSLLVIDNSQLKKQVAELTSGAESYYQKYTTDNEHIKHDILRLNRQINSAQLAKYMDMSIYALKSDFQFPSGEAAWPVVISDRSLYRPYNTESQHHLTDVIRSVIEDYIIDFSRVSLQDIEADVERNKRDSVYYKRLVSVADAQDNYVGPEGECDCSKEEVVVKIDNVTTELRSLQQEVTSLDVVNVLQNIHSAVISSFSSLPSTIYYAFLRENMLHHKVSPTAKSVDQVRISGLTKGPALSLMQIFEAGIHPTLIQRVLASPVVLVPTPKGTYIRLADSQIGDSLRVTLADVLLESAEFYDNVFV